MDILTIPAWPLWLFSYSSFVEIDLGGGGAFFSYCWLSLLASTIVGIMWHHVNWSAP